VKQKLSEIQALRGVAILMVVAFHFSVRWDSVSTNGKSLYPFADVPGFARLLLSQGRLGVELFFMISGFVIALTLENSSSFADFWKRRLARLWPPLLICLPLLWLVLQVAPPFEASGKSLTALWISFTLLNPLFFGMGQTGQVTGVLWTLWVELQFYLLASLLFFRFKGLRRGVLAASFLSVVLVLLTFTTDGLPVELFFQFFGLPIYLPWFAAGVIAYQVRKREAGKGLWLAFVGCFAMSVISLVYLELKLEPAGFGNGMAALAMLTNTLFLVSLRHWRQAKPSRTR